MAAVTGLDSGGMAGGVRKTMIAATTGHTADQVQQSKLRLHGVIIGSAVANAVITLYESSTNSNSFAVITMSSLATAVPVGLDFKGVELDKLAVGVSGAAANVTILWS